MEIPLDKFRLTYNSKHCWQYEIRVQNLARDLGTAGLTPEEASNLKIQSGLKLALSSYENVPTILGILKGEFLTFTERREVEV